MKISSLIVLSIFCSLAYSQTAEEILDKAAEAIGGKAVQEKVKTSVMLGTVTIPGGYKGATEVYAKKGGKLLVHFKLDLPGMKMESITGCDGTDCYSQDPNFGLRLLEGQEKESILLQNDPLNTVNWRELYSKIEYKGMGEVAGRKTHDVYQETTSGMEAVYSYDAETMLLLRSEGTSQSPMGSMKFTMDFKDYKDVGHGFMMAMTTEMAAMGQKMEMKVDEVELNSEIPDTKFALPAGLK